MRKKRIKIVFWGTSKFAENILELLLKNDSFDVVAVVTRTDKLVGRKREIVSPIVKQMAEKSNITVLQPEKLDNDFETKLKKINTDIFVVASYGKIIPKNILDIPRHGSVNAHGSLLPKYRGASPIQTAIVNGEEKTGITLILMDAGMDTGDILKQQEIEIYADDTYKTLLEKLSESGAKMLNDVLPVLVDGKIKSAKQDSAKATYTKILRSMDYEIDWNKSAKEIHNFVRGMYPNAYGTVWINNKGMRVKVALSSVEYDKNFKFFRPRRTSLKLAILNFQNGTLFGYEKKLFVTCGKAESLEIKKIQMAGKNVISGKDFLNGQRDIKHMK